MLEPVRKMPLMNMARSLAQRFTVFGSARGRFEHYGGVSNHGTDRFDAPAQRRLIVSRCSEFRTTRDRCSDFVA
jgi:hypothetical protein